jgi:hypothetical protein
MRRALSAGFAGLCLLACSAAQPSAPKTTLAPEAGARMPARLRRLSNAEYEKAASELLAAPIKIANRLPPDVRQEGFTVNAEQAVPAGFATRLASLADELAEQAANQRLAEIAPCANSDAEQCAQDFVLKFARRAFRRPITRSEQQGLLELFRAGQADEKGFAGGVQLVLSALLQAPSFLYISEVGDTRADGSHTLSSLEMASSLAFAVRGGPPDADLLQAGIAGELNDPAAREYQARRLLGQSDTRHHFRRFVLEWLEVDQLENTAKSLETAPRFEALKRPMLDETRRFVDEVMVHRGASLRSLLGAGFVSVDEPMARYYGLHAYGARVRAMGSGRLGLLQHASFLSAHAHEDSTSPVKRGDFVMRKLLCSKLPRPAELNIEVTIPAPDPKLTTRQRFSAHVTNKSCQACHASIDALGFTFENFDAAGKLRSQDNGAPVDTSARFSEAGETRSFANSIELSHWLASNPDSHQCFARHAFRYFTAQSNPALDAEFLKLLSTLPAAKRESLVELVVAYVRSDLFARRGAPK